MNSRIFKSFLVKNGIYNKNLNKSYRISYVGEPAIDTGGVSRDFYSGMVFLT